MTQSAGGAVRRFTGTLANVPNGYGFIDINTVHAIDGEDHNLGAFDVFVAQSECPVSLEAGLVLSFEVRPNPAKGEDHWRAFNVSEVLVGELMPAKGDLVPGFRTVPGANALVVHSGVMTLDALRKHVPAEDVALVRQNHPLKGIPADEDGIEIPDDVDQIRAGMMRYLFGLFPQLKSVGITFEVVGYSEEAQDALIAEHAKALQDMGMIDQKSNLDALYRQFKATRQTLVWIVERELLATGTPLSPVVLTSIIKMVQDKKTAEEKAKGTQDVMKCVDWMLERGLLRANTALPMEVLPDLFMACPVWFQQTADTPQGNNKDPHVAESTQFFCGLFPKSEPWWDTFQMFNRRIRPITTYRGDQIPMHVLRIIQQARQVFDYVVIMTPYLDIAGADWKDLAWIRSIDPYLVGFKKGLPFFFVLARWTDSGLFPGHTELVADTLTFLREKKSNLVGFDTVQCPYWGIPSNLTGSIGRLGTRLMQRVDELLHVAQMGHLFDWLRGEWNLPKTELVSPRPTDLSHRS